MRIHFATHVSKLGLLSCFFVAQTSLAAIISGNATDPFNGNSNLECVDPTATAPGAQLEQEACGFASGTSSRLATTSIGVPKAPYYWTVTVKFNATGQCLEVAPGALANGAPVRQAPCTGTANQQWKWVWPYASSYPASESYLIEYVNVQSGKCLDVTAMSTQSGAKLQQWTCNATKNQLWYPFN